jgi:hypothetical protein
LAHGKRHGRGGCLREVCVGVTGLFAGLLTGLLIGPFAHRLVGLAVPPPASRSGMRGLLCSLACCLLRTQFSNLVPTSRASQHHKRAGHARF